MSMSYEECMRRGLVYSRDEKRDFSEPQQLWSYLRSFGLKTTLWSKSGPGSFDDLHVKLKSRDFVLEERGETLVLVCICASKAEGCSFLGLDVVVK